MGYKRQQKRKYMHLTGWICADAKKPKSILNNPKQMRHVNEMIIFDLERLDAEESKWYATYVRTELMNS